MAARIVATPEIGLIDSPVAIRLEGFRPRAVITVRARVEVPDRTIWTSSAEFLVGPEGTVDLGTEAPIFGDYLVPDAEGLIWSLRQDPASPVPQFNSRFILTPGHVPYGVELKALHRDEVLATARLTRVPLADDVTRSEVRDDGLVGTLFLPPGDGPHPVIVVVPGSDGGVPEPLAALYASHGWASLALGYFAVAGTHLPPTLTEIPLEYFETALAWIARNPQLDERRIVVNGTSRGGELALLLGSRYPEFSAVLAWVPGAYVTGGMGPGDAEAGRSSWTHGGVPLPYLPRGIDESPSRERRDGIQVFAIRALRHVEDRDAWREFEIPVERIAGPLLLVSGVDDLLWPSGVYSRWVVERLAEHGFPHPVEHLSYPNAGHTLGPSGAPATINATGELPGADPDKPVGGIHLGGNPQGIAAARQELWPRVLDWIAERLGVPDRVPR